MYIRDSDNYIRELNDPGVGVYAIDTIELIAGQLPRRQHRLVEAWAELHQRELLADWERLQSGQTPFKIDPLQ